MYRVAFQGEYGAYSELAALKYFRNKAETLPCKTFQDLFDSVARGGADFGMVPVENSLEGSVGQNYDLLMNSSLNVCGETVFRVEHCLIANPKTEMKDVEKVYSHPQALGQCRKFIEENRLDAIPVYDTAGSVKQIKESKEMNVAAIASELSAKIYGMKIIRKGIETDRNNFTRFLVISRKKITTRREKTSIILMLKHRPGSLFSALKPFSDNKINLTKLESRPIIGKPWEYSFYLDFEGDSEDVKIKRILKELRKHSDYLKVIGSYPRAGGVFLESKTQKPEAREWPEGKKIAIIGATGGMGRWFCRFFLSEGLSVIASGRTRSKLEKLGKELGVEISENNEEAVKRADIIFISVMLEDFRNVIKEIAPFVRSNKLILDMTSSKQEPVGIMHRYIKEGVILGTHPLFGPGAEGTNQSIILTPTNRKEALFADKLSIWLSGKGFSIMMMSPKKHDEAMSVVLGLSHFVGLALGKTWSSFNFPELRRAQPTSFKRLLGLVENVAASDPEFYANLQMILPQVVPTERKFIENAERILKLVKKGDEEGFAEEMRKLRKLVNGTV